MLSRAQRDNGECKYVGYRHHKSVGMSLGGWPEEQEAGKVLLLLPAAADLEGCQRTIG